METISVPRCRWCGGKLVKKIFIGHMPLVNHFTYIKSKLKEKKFPLTLCMCSRCSLVQVVEVAPPPVVFDHYAYLSGASDPLINEFHDIVREASSYVTVAHRSVLDIGSNDGSLLQIFEKLGWKAIGIEPSKFQQKISRKKSLTVIPAFFTADEAQRLRSRLGVFPVITVIHVLANIVDLDDFFAGISILLAADGVCIIEVDAVEDMVREHRFDSIYHEHYSYFSQKTAAHIAAYHGFDVVHMHHVDAQGGSWRFVLRKQVQQTKQITKALPTTNQELDLFVQFEKKLRKTKQERLDFLTSLSQGKKVACFGVPAKGVIVLNYLELTRELISYAVDATPGKQGSFVPGTNIPIYAEEYLRLKPVDLIIVLSWNYRQDIVKKLEKLVLYPVKLCFLYPTMDTVELTHNQIQ